MNSAFLRGRVMQMPPDAESSRATRLSRNLPFAPKMSTFMVTAFDQHFDHRCKRQVLFGLFPPALSKAIPHLRHSLN